MNLPQEAYPLTWPSSWPRQSSRQESRFKRPCRYNARQKSMYEATSFLTAELTRLGASKCVISTNVKLKLDGTPYSNQAQPSDPGAAIYFILKGKPIVLACDRWNRVEDNVYAVAKHIESIRAQDRWGVGRIEQAFAGYMALPAPMTLKPWWQVLGVPENAPREAIESAWRHLAKKNHPDLGGTHEGMSEINTAWENAKLIRGWN